MMPRLPTAIKLSFHIPLDIIYTLSPVVPRPLRVAFVDTHEALYLSIDFLFKARPGGEGALNACYMSLRVDRPVGGEGQGKRRSVVVVVVGEGGSTTLNNSPSVKCVFLQFENLLKLVSSGVATAFMGGQGVGWWWGVLA